MQHLVTLDVVLVFTHWSNVRDWEFLCVTFNLTLVAWESAAILVVITKCDVHGSAFGPLESLSSRWLLHSYVIVDEAVGLQAVL
jgi:hypothetical protein